MSAFALKIIASICMLIDHIGAVFPVPLTPAVFRLIGRIAFPIYAYLIAEGCKHTKNKNKYLLRLGIFAIISEIPFDLAFMQYQTHDFQRLNINFFYQTNVFYSLFLGAACICVYESLKTKRQPWIALIPLIIVPISLVLAFLLQDKISWRIPLSIGFLTYTAAALWLSHFLYDDEATPKTVLLRNILPIVVTVPIFMLGSIMDTDYGMYAVLYILIFYLAKPDNRIIRTIIMFVVVFLEYAYPYFFWLCFRIYRIRLFLLPGKAMFFQSNLDYFWFALASVPLVFLYNGKQGPKVKWAFYIFYPAHIAALVAIKFVISR